MHELLHRKLQQVLDAALNPGHLTIAEGGRLLDHYETEQLCEKLSLAQLQALRSRLEDNQGFCAAQQGILQVRDNTGTASTIVKSPSTSL